MSDRLISADKLIKSINRQIDKAIAPEELKEMMRRALLLEIANTPTVYPIKHGQWELSPFDGNWTCSICGDQPYHSNMKNMNYCPNCGAKMDKKERK